MKHIKIALESATFGGRVTRWFMPDYTEKCITSTEIWLLEKSGYKPLRNEKFIVVVKY